MNSRNALIFVALGAAMRLLPQVAPQWFPATAFDGTSAAALWMMAMGTVQGVLGGWYLIRWHLVGELRRWTRFGLRQDEAPPEAVAWGLTISH
jgi:hypothetical protein